MPQMFNAVSRLFYYYFFHSMPFSCSPTERGSIEITRLFKGRSPDQLGGVKIGERCHAKSDSPASDTPNNFFVAAGSKRNRCSIEPQRRLCHSPTNQFFNLHSEVHSGDYAIRARAGYFSVFGSLRGKISIFLLLH